MAMLLMAMVASIVTAAILARTATTKSMLACSSKRTATLPEVQMLCQLLSLVPGIHRLHVWKTKLGTIRKGYRKVCRTNVCIQNALQLLYVGSCFCFKDTGGFRRMHVMVNLQDQTCLLSCLARITQRRLLRLCCMPLADLQTSTRTNDKTVAQAG